MLATTMPLPLTKTAHARMPKLALIVPVTAYLMTTATACAIKTKSLVARTPALATTMRMPRTLATAITLIRVMTAPETA